MEDEKLLSIYNLKTHFFTRKGVVPAVDGVNIEVPKGKIIGVVGESGCGKSMTAMSIINLIKKPGKIVEGSIELEDKKLIDLSKKELQKIRGNEIGFIFQEPMTSLNPVYTIGKQGIEAILLHESESKEEAKKRVIEIFKEVGIPEPEKRYNSYPHQLSGGLRQRVVIGMAMICKPKLLIADEPTTALDVTIEAQILKLMKKLQKENGTSILMITHNLGIVAEICDYVYVMYAGKVMEQADVFELFDNISHPYTEGLMKSMPRIDSHKDNLYSIRGMVPNLLKLPKGCLFCPRCDKAISRCFEEEPELYKVEEGHYTRCFLYEKEVVR